jgi:hypothetical protein
VDLVVMDRKPVVTYLGCPTCTKKKCGEHSDPAIPIFYHQFVFLDVQDGISTIVGSIRGEEVFEDLQPGDKVRVYGKVTRYKETLNLRVYEYYVIRRMSIDKVNVVSSMDKLMDELKTYTKIPQKVFEERMNQEGVNQEDLKNHIRLVVTDKGSWYELVL